jgi:hypothetical protein
VKGEGVKGDDSRVAQLEESIMIRNRLAWTLVLAIGGGVSLALAQDKKDERGGTCEDAKKQFEHFCEKKGHQDDIMMQAPLACDNAKRNMAAACEGKGEQDRKYEFKESK